MGGQLVPAGTLLGSVSTVWSGGALWSVFTKLLLGVRSIRAREDKSP